LTTGTATSTTYGGVISGTGGLTKVGTGVFTLTGNNTYTGLTTVSAGTLQIGSGGTSGSIAGDIIDNSLLQFNRSDSLVVNGNVTGSGRIIQVGAGTTTLNGNNVLSALSGNAVSVNAGTLMMNGGSYRANVNDGKAIVVTNANTQLNGVTVMTTDGGGSGSSASTSGAFGVSVSGPSASMTGSNYGAAGSRLRASLLVAASKRGIRAAHRSNRQRLGSHKGRAVANRSTV
ncbi:MAG: autotransporter-associated beta strand repeat-containing protein, partial [Terrimicrobiaceae bacterium]